jgi:DNA primase
MKKHTAAKAYCEGRGLKYHDFLGIGYKSQKTKDKWGRGCIILPLRDAAGKTVSLYGRAIKGAGHYYTAGRKGLYPYHPDPTTKTLILTESVIDAASIRRYEFELDLYALLALYGTNGLTAEHKTAITNLKDLREIILALDNDAAGIKATEAIAAELMELKPGLTISFLELPEGGDVSEVASQSEDVEATFNDLFARREIIANAAPVVPSEIPTSNLNTDNRNNLIYQSHTATYEVKGGVRTAPKDLDSLKVTLAILSEEGRRSRQKLDLYEDKQTSRCARAVAERLGLRADLIELDLDRLTELLESHRETIRTEIKREETTKITVNQADRTRCLQFLKAPDLLTRINELIERAGITGEENNRLLLFVVASSLAMPTTLHALIQGASGSGKTRLLRVVSDLVPEEAVKRYTRVTDGSFYNQGEYYFSHKLLCFEDIDGLKEEALLAVRELQSSEILITSTSFKDEHGNIRSKIKGLSGRNRVIIGLLVHQALLVSEIVALRVGDIDLVAATVYVSESVGNRARQLPLVASQVMILHSYIERDRPLLVGAHPEPGRLIVSRFGKALAGHGISRLLNGPGYLQRGKRFLPLRIRQSVIAHKLKAGHDLRAVQVFAGHRQISSTEAYRQDDLEQLKAGIAKHHPLQ